ncbi:ribosomal protein S18-alanine N-acetyltransferase [Amphibacillus marinus]|nr:ribosomal protein S18-alanine N-acetyltransferase [Amphibacillus marinus]
MPNVSIRAMELVDLDEVALIEVKSFTTPWSKALYQKELIENQFAHYYVIEVNQQVVGFCGVWLVLDEAQVTNIAIDPSYRGKGYGAMLFQYILNRALLRGATQLSLEVRKSNHAAKAMYKKFGLEKAGIRKNYYTDNNEDAIVMWVKL